MSITVDFDYKPVEGLYLLNNSNYRKYANSMPALICERCGKRQGEGGVEVKRCTGCVKVGFCSTECQRQLWLTHKEDCNIAQVVLLIEDMVQNLCADPFLLHLLRVALIFKLGLLSKSTASTKEAILETVHLHITPVEFGEEMKLITEAYDAVRGKERIPGCLSVGLNYNEAPQIVSIARPQHHNMAAMLYKQARKEADKNGRKDNPIILVNFGYDTEAVVHALEITKDAFETAKGNIPRDIIPDSMKDAEFNKVVNAQAALKLLNDYIVRDKEDKLKLRKDVRRADKIFVYKRGRAILSGRV